jgi:hypothetical protein
MWMTVRGRTGRERRAPAQAWVATRPDRAPLVPCDLEALGDHAAFNARLPVVLGVHRSDEVDRVLLAAQDHIAGAHVPRSHAVLRREQVALAQRRLNGEELRDSGGGSNGRGDLG